jgi:hypothetical protein
LLEGLNRLAYIEAGLWTITLPNVGAHVPQANSFQTNVTVGSIARVGPVTYAATGTLDVVVNGLSGVAAQGTITGPNGWSRPLTGSQVFEGVALGTYVVTPATVTTSSALYKAPPQNGVVEAGQTRRVTITYALANPVLTIASAGSGTGRVTSNPAGIDCAIADGVPSATGCSASFAYNASVQLSVAQGTLMSWADACSGGAATCQVAMSQDRRVVATFAVPPAIVLKTTKPVIVTDFIQDTIWVDYSIQNGGGGVLAPSISVTPTLYPISLSIVGGSVLRVAINGAVSKGLRPYSEQQSPYIVTATLSSNGAADVPITIKYVRTFDQPTGMAARVVRFHRNSGAAPEATPPSNIDALLNLVDARSNSTIAAEIIDVTPVDQNWLDVTINQSGQLVLKVKPFTAPQVPAGLLPPAPGALGSPIQIRLKKAGSNPQCPNITVPADPKCQVFVYYTADPWPKLLLRPWGVQLTVDNDTASAAIEPQPGGIGTTLGQYLVGSHTCSNKLATPAFITPDNRIHVKGNFTALQENEQFRCEVEVTATYMDDQGQIQGTDRPKLEIVMTKPGPDVITPNRRDLNILATAGASIATADSITLVNLGANVISLGAATIVDNSCPGGLFAQPTLTGTALGRGTAQIVILSVNPQGQTPRTCTAKVRLQSTTTGVPTEDIPLTVRLK